MKKIPNGAENVFLGIEQAVTEVLNKFHYPNSHLQMRQNAISVAEHSQHYLFPWGTGSGLIVSKMVRVNENWVMFDKYLPLKGNCRICYAAVAATDFAVSGGAAANKFHTLSCCSYGTDGKYQGIL